ncbi:Hsp90 cochaperone shq1 [Aphanomyces cochlioides]|nr:Hsp90 cochaperone shq1 [Aphanomyces cochlioides]
MPSTPRFKVTQDATTVFVEIHVPYVRVSEMEYHIDGTNFSFWCKPYLLNLTFPGAVVDDDRAKAVYDMNKNHGTITVHLPKETPDEHFPDLDLLTTLLQKKWKPEDEGLPDSLAKAPLIQVVESSDSKECEQVETPTTTPPQVASKTDSSLLSFEDKEPPIKVSVGPPTYGFNNSFSDLFKCWHGELHEVISLPTPETSSPLERRQLRTAVEDEDFDVERYLMDFVNQSEDEYFQGAIAFTPFWTTLPPWTPPTPASLIVDITSTMAAVDLDSPSSPSPAAVVFTDKENELLLRLPRKEYLPFSPTESRYVWHGLLDILAAYCYDMRATQGEPNVESPWTLSILSPTLSWLDTPDTLADVVKHAFRRALTYPFLRQWDLIHAAVTDVVNLLKRGKRVVLRVLLAIYSVFEKSETYYLLNTLYIQDYATWIQTIQDSDVSQWGDQLGATLAAFQKDQTGWALTQMERALLEEDDEEESSDDEEDSDESDDESPTQ